MSDATSDRLADRALAEPSRARLALDHPRRAEILARHEEALQRGAPSYVDPDSAYLVFTSRYLAERGHCCASSCRHCPYVDDAVDDQGA